jgi:hypothetical protein
MSGCRGVEWELTGRAYGRSRRRSARGRPAPSGAHPPPPRYGVSRPRPLAARRLRVTGPPPPIDAHACSKDGARYDACLDSHPQRLGGGREGGDLAGIVGGINMRDPVIHPPIRQDRRVVGLEDAQVRLVNEVVRDHEASRRGVPLARGPHHACTRHARKGCRGGNGKRPRHDHASCPHAACYMPPHEPSASRLAPPPAAPRLGQLKRAHLLELSVCLSLSGAHLLEPN